MVPENVDMIQLLRDVMSNATTGIQLADGIKDIPAAMAKRLHFPKREDWMAFGSCLYTFEDAAMAIRGYFATAASGLGCDHEYLRLFGFLNACYLQLGAVDQLCKVVGVPNSKAIIGELRKHEIIECRNMLASHTVAYKSEGVTHSITIEQRNLGGTGAIFMVNEKFERRQCSFTEMHQSWVVETRRVLREIVRKFIMTAYKPNPQKQNEWLARLNAI